MVYDSSKILNFLPTAEKSCGRQWELLVKDFYNFFSFNNLWRDERTFSAISIVLWTCDFYHFSTNSPFKFMVLAALALYSALWWINCLLCHSTWRNSRKLIKISEKLQMKQYLLFKNLIDSQRIFNNSIASIWMELLQMIWALYKTWLGREYLRNYFQRSSR